MVKSFGLFYGIKCRRKFREFGHQTAASRDASARAFKSLGYRVRTVNPKPPKNKPPTTVI